MFSHIANTPAHGVGNVNSAVNPARSVVLGVIFAVVVHSIVILAESPTLGDCGVGHVGIVEGLVAV